MYANSQEESQNTNPYRGDDGMSAGSSSNSRNNKSKRRSKKDNEGRNFKCDK